MDPVSLGTMEITSLRAADIFPPPQNCRSKIRLEALAYKCQVYKEKFNVEISSPLWKEKEDGSCFIANNDDSMFWY